MQQISLFDFEEPEIKQAKIKARENHDDDLKNLAFYIRQPKRATTAVLDL